MTYMIDDDASDEVKAQRQRVDLAYTMRNTSLANWNTYQVELEKLAEMTSA